MACKLSEMGVFLLASSQLLADRVFHLKTWLNAVSTMTQISERKAVRTRQDVVETVEFQVGKFTQAIAEITGE